MIVHNVLKRIRVLVSVAYATFKEWAAYRSHMLVSLFVGPVYFLIQYFIWHAIFQDRDTLNGFTFPQMLSYYGIVTLINYCIMDFADWNLQMLIHTGKFITFLLRPMSHIYFAFSQKVGHRILGFCLEFIPVYLLFALLFGIVLAPVHFIWSLISILLGFIMMFLVDYAIGIMGFWLVRTGGIRRMFLLIRDILAGVFIPLAFLPVGLQRASLFLPFQYITYVPVRVFLGSYDLGGLHMTIPAIVLLQALAVLLMGVMTRLLWSLGINKFTGVGA